MLSYRRWSALALAFCFMLTGFALGSTQTPADAQTTPNSNPNVNITFPPPVYVVRGEVEVRGTVNLPNLSNYFLEFRPLGDDFLPLSEDEPFVPASPAQTGVKIDDVLLTWDTTILEDGLYEIRLRANVSRQPAVDAVVGPIRVENDIPDFLVELLQPTPTSTITPSSSVIVIGGTPTPGGVIITRPTLAASPSPTGDPVVTANTDANVRSGDTTSYPVIGTLLSGNQARLIGISASGSGWYYVELSNGRRGFMAPSVVTVAGNVANLQRIQPPPPPATATPTPRPTTGDAVPNGIALVPVEPRCNEPFSVQVNITNAGSAPFSSGGTISIRNVATSNGATTNSATGTFPPLSPGQNFVVVIPFSVTQFNGQENQIIATADVNNEIIEENEGNNVFVHNYRLRRAGCP